MSAKLPAGWRVELLGLINAVQFTKGDMSLLWCDDSWIMSHRSVHRPATGLPRATNMKQARTVGTAWLAEAWLPH